VGLIRFCPFPSKIQDSLVKTFFKAEKKKIIKKKNYSFSLFILFQMAEIDVLEIRVFGDSGSSDKLRRFTVTHTT